MRRKIKYISNQEAVSVVIGVIIMVAITVAMAAVSYAYLTGMIGGDEMTPVADIQIKDGAATATAGAYTQAGDEVFTIFHYSGDIIVIADVAFEYKGGLITEWTVLTTTEPGGLTATMPTDGFFQFGDEISVTAVDATTQSGSYVFRIRYNPSNSWIKTETTATAI